MCLLTPKRKGSIMGFRVCFKTGRPITVDAEKFEVKDGVYLFSKAASELVASFPVSNVSSVVKDQA